MKLSKEQKIALVTSFEENALLALEKIETDVYETILLETQRLIVTLSETGSIMLRAMDAENYNIGQRVLVIESLISTVMPTFIAALDRLSIKDCAICIDQLTKLQSALFEACVYQKEDSAARDIVAESELIKRLQSSQVRSVLMESRPGVCRAPQARRTMELNGASITDLSVCLASPLDGEMYSPDHIIGSTYLVLAGQDADYVGDEMIGMLMSDEEIKDS